VAGVQSRTETLYKACLRRGLARVVFVNKMDRRGASFFQASDDLARLLDPGAIPVQIPWGEGDAFRGVVDLVDMVAYEFDEGRKGRAPRVPIPAELEAAARAGRGVLIEALAGAEPGEAGALLEAYVTGRDPEPALLRGALRAATLAGRTTPVLCGSAFSDGAAALLLDAVAAYLPSPGEASFPEGIDPATEAILRREASDPFSALVFKTGSDPHFGRLSWARLWSGRLAAGERILDASSGQGARVQKIFRIQADRLEALESAEFGDIVALALAPSKSGAKGAEAQDLGATGATLCEPSAPILYEPIRFAEPVATLAIEPRTRADGELLREAVAALVEEDPSLRVREDELTGRIELSGQGELHLEVAAERLSRERGARIRVGKPRVSYRETLASSAVGREDFDRDLGGERVRARVALRLGPGERGSGLTFRAELPGKLPSILINAARRGVEAALSVGPTAGFPLDDVEALLVELGAGRSGDSTDKASERGVEIAASLAAGSAARAASSLVIEPIMRLEIEVPEEGLGEAAAAVSGRGGRIESVEESGPGARIVVGAAPLRRLFGFAGELRSGTAGKGSYVARFLRYEPVPKGFQDWG
jgi:elongation factor G